MREKKWRGNLGRLASSARAGSLAAVILALCMLACACGAGTAEAGGGQTLDVDVMVNENYREGNTEAGGTAAALAQGQGSGSRQGQEAQETGVQEESETSGLEGLYSQGNAQKAQEGLSSGEGQETQGEDSAVLGGSGNNNNSGSGKETDAGHTGSGQEAGGGETEASGYGKKSTVTITIRCDTAVNNGMASESKWAGIVPASGCILDVTEVEFDEGATVFDILCAVRDKYHIHMQYTGGSGSQYIQGINNLYEFDGGRWSGWMYCVNGWYPNYGCGQYAVKNGDVIEWNYTCDLGIDLGTNMNGAEEWMENNE